MTQRLNVTHVKECNACEIYSRQLPMGVARGQYLETFVRVTNSLEHRYRRFEYLESFVI